MHPSLTSVSLWTPATRAEGSSGERPLRRHAQRWTGDSTSVVSARESEPLCSSAVGGCRLRPRVQGTPKPLRSVQQQHTPPPTNARCVVSEPTFRKLEVETVRSQSGRVYPSVPARAPPAFSVSSPAPPGSRSRRAHPGGAPYSLALNWASPLGLVAGLQQACTVPLRRRLVSRVLPGSGLRNSGGSASLRRWRKPPRPRRRTEWPLHAEAAARGGREPHRLEAPRAPAGE